MRRVFLLFLLFGVTTTAANAQFIGPGGTLPAVANLPGLEGTFWRTDLNVLNPNDAPTWVVLQLFPEVLGLDTTEFETQITDPIKIDGNTQKTFSNLVQSQFGFTNKKGALRVYTTDGASVVLSARTYTYDTEGKSYGHEVSGVLVANSAWVAGLAEDALYRSNIGIFWPWDESVFFTVTVYHADGTLAGQDNVYFGRSGMKQPSVSQFGVTTLIDGFAVITCSDPTALWYAYGARVDEISGDAVFKPALGRYIGLN